MGTGGGQGERPSYWNGSTNDISKSHNENLKNLRPKPVFWPLSGLSGLCSCVDSERLVNTSTQPAEGKQKTRRDKLWVLGVNEVCVKVFEWRCAQSLPSQAS